MGLAWGLGTVLWPCSTLHDGLQLPPQSVIHKVSIILFHDGFSLDIESSSPCYTVEPCCLRILYTMDCTYEPQIMENNVKNLYMYCYN